MVERLAHMMNWIEEEYEKAEAKGITVMVEGVPYVPYQRDRVLRILEETTYMKDYIDDERGNIIQINFSKITSC